jgi:hypothetical protein
MPQKLLVVILTSEEHKSVARYALEMDTTMSNLVRRLLGLPEVRMGRAKANQQRPSEENRT